MTSAMPVPSDKRWAFFGATGVTGAMVLSRALAAGHRPTLVGRDAARLNALAAPHGLNTVIADLDDPASLRAAIAGHTLVLNAAGPFTRTAAPLIDAALAEGVDYVDLNGEIDPLEALFERDAEAKSLGVVLIGGAGFGIAAGDGLAALVREGLGGLDEARVAVSADSAFNSPAVAESTLGVLAGGGREICRGTIVRSGLARTRWSERLPDGQTVAFASAPLAELSAIRHALEVQTAIAGVPMPGIQARVLATIAPLLPLLLKIGPIRREMAQAGGHGAQDSADQRGFVSRVWVTGRFGKKRVTARLDAGEGFAVASDIAVRAVETMLAFRPTPGTHTPASAFGARWIETVPGVVIHLEQQTTL